MFEKKKFVIVLVRKEYQSINLLKKIECNKISEILRIEDKTFNIHIQTPLFKYKDKLWYFLDVENGNQLKFSEIEAQLNPAQLDLIISTDIIKQLTAGALDKKEKIIMAILGFIIGILAGIVGMMFYMNDEIARIYESLGVLPA